MYGHSDGDSLLSKAVPAWLLTSIFFMIRWYMYGHSTIDSLLSKDFKIVIKLLPVSLVKFEVNCDKGVGRNRQIVFGDVDMISSYVKSATS